MTMRAAVAAFILAAMAAAQADDLYWCTSGNTSRLTSQPLAGSDCKLIDKGGKSRKADKPASTTTSKIRPQNRNFPRVLPEQQRQRDLTRRQILEYELLEQRRKLQMVRQVLEGPKARRNAKVAKEYSIRSDIHELNIIAIEQELDRLE